MTLLGKFCGGGDDDEDGGSAGELVSLIRTFTTHVLDRPLDEGSCEVLLATACGARGSNGSRWWCSTTTVG